MRALVTGITGQDGHYAARALLDRGDEVIGVTSRAAGVAAAAAELASPRLTVRALDFMERGRIDALVDEYRPDLLLNFASFATGTGMFDNPASLCRVNGEFVLDVLEAARRIHPAMRVVQASSAEMYGDSDSERQDEDSPFRPKSPYGAAKLHAHNLVRVYRTAYGLKCSSAILLNHESVRRPPAFVTRKIAQGVARISLGLAGKLALGSLDTRRDWGFAPEYVAAMIAMGESDAPDDYVLATGRHSTIRELCEIAFGHVGLDWREHVEVDSAFARTIATRPLLGCPERIHAALGWKAEVPVAQVITQMVDHDLALFGRDLADRSEGAAAG